MIIDGWGFVFWNGLLQSMPFRNQRAAYSYTRTFLERQNTSGKYGDNDQDFFLTASQNDWSLGEGQNFLRLNDTGSVRKYWKGSAVDVTVPGQVAMRTDLASVAFGSTVMPLATRYNQSTIEIYAGGATNLFKVDNTGTVTDIGAHGLGAAVAKFGMASDSTNLYMTTPAGGTVGVRKWTGAAFSTFSATAADAIEYLNNTLYGIVAASGILISYSTTGVATTIYTWKDAAGAATNMANSVRIRAFGGKLLILTSSTDAHELWQYDGTNTTIVAKFAPNFIPHDIAANEGIAYISGMFRNNTTSEAKPALYQYTSAGAIELLWQADIYSTATQQCAVTVYENRIVFNDDTRAVLMFYDLSTGAIHAFGSYLIAGTNPVLCGGTRFLLHSRNQATAYRYPSATYATTTGVPFVALSLIDFENSLTKSFRGIKVVFTAATDGNGGSVDIWYNVDSLSANTGTVLKTGATSGTEYTLSGVSGTAIAPYIVLNKGTSTSGPTLKRVYVRASPVQQSFRRCQYVLDLTGAKAQDPVPLHDGTYSTLTGSQLAANLVTAITSTTPISITDRFGTYNAVFEQGEGITELDEVRPGEFVAQVTTREV